MKQIIRVTKPTRIRALAAIAFSMTVFPTEAIQACPYSSRGSYCF